MPLLDSTRREAQCLAAFHFAMEAAIKKEQGRHKVRIGLQPSHWFCIM